MTPAAPDRQTRRDRLLRSLAEGIPYIAFIGMTLERRGDEITGILEFAPKLLGNPNPPALHGGVVAAFLEATALFELTWQTHLAEPDGKCGDGTLDRPRMPRTISFSVDYLRPGKPESAFARAAVARAGRRYASVHVEAWQERRNRMFAQATGHFLMPQAHD